MELFILWIISAFVAAAVGGRKDRAGSGLLLAIFLGPLGILAAWALKGNRKECRYCRKLIHIEATVCVHCLRELPPCLRASRRQATEKPEKRDELQWG